MGRINSLRMLSLAVWGCVISPFKVRGPSAHSAMWLFSTEVFVWSAFERAILMKWQKAKFLDVKEENGKQVGNVALF